MESINLSNASDAMIQISRPVYTNDNFNEAYPPKIPEDISRIDDVRKFLQRQRCGCDLAKRVIYYLVPSIKWIPKYDLREFLVCDLIAGLTVGVVNIPQGMAYSMLAALAPVYGLYVSFFPVLIYFLLGTSRHISIGTFAVVSIMCGNAVERVISTIEVPTAPPTTTSFNMSSPTVNVSAVDSEYLEAERIKIHTALCLMVGIFQMLMGTCRLGFVTVYLSDSLIRAFICGVAFHIITSQMKYFFGLTISRYRDPFSVIYTWRDIFLELPNMDVAELIIAVIAMTSLVIVKILATKYEDKIKYPIPVELIIVVIGTIASFFGKLPAKFGVDPVGHIPTGFSNPTVPSTNYFGQLIKEAFGISIVGCAASVSLAKMFASKHNYEINSNQEWIAYGAANVFSSFFSCFVSSASLTRSVIQDTVGGKTQFASVIQCSLVLVVVMWLGPVLEPLPKVVLAVIIVCALKNTIIQAMDLKTLWSQSKYDWMIWLVTLWAVILLGVDTGLLIGVGFSLLTVVFRTQFAHYVLSGNMAGTEIYKNVEDYPDAECSDGIMVFQMQSSLYFANVQRFRNRLYELTGVHPEKILKKEEKNTTGKWRKLANRDYQPMLDGDKTTTSSAASTSIPQHDLETIVIDCSAFNFIDLMAVKTLIGVVTDYEKIGVGVVLAQCKDCVQDTLNLGGFFEHVSPDQIYLTVHDAVLSLSTNVNQVTANGTIQEMNAQHLLFEESDASET